MVRSALTNIVGVSDLKVPGQNSPYPHVKIKGQIIEYTGPAKPEDVIAILHNKTSFEVEVATPPKTETTQPPQIDRSEQGGADQPATAVESKTEGKKKPKPKSEGREVAPGNGASGLLTN